MATKFPLHIVRGKTLVQPIQWASRTLASKAISGISFAAGFPRLTVVGHGMPDGWRGAVFGVEGVPQINAVNTPLRLSDFRTCTVIDADTVELNGVVPVDANGFRWPDYVSGGFLTYYTPMDLSTREPVVVFKTKPGGTVLMSNRPADGALNVLTAAKDNTNKQVIITIPADVAATCTWKKAYWEVEMQASAADVLPLILPSEVTTGDEVVT